ncbi:acyltransferase [Armatimonas sp.]|uniref:acyltransferase family protein n=1 Tax=Armatimonas sp. TaxID=1872638 RepID=UPI00286AED37|nr:acyltransferase [Armatimonas sp.]
MSKPPPRLSYLSLDLWRGLASVMVVIYHAAGVHSYHHKELIGSPIFRLAEYGWLGVQMFFVISGFCIANAAVISLSRDSHPRDFFLARFRRIFPPYWCSLIVFFILLKITDYLSSHHFIAGNGFSEGVDGLFSSHYIFLNLFLAQYLITIVTRFSWNIPSILPISWTLCYELAFYILIGFALVAVGRRCGARMMLRSLHCLTLLCVLANAIWGTLVPYPFCMWPNFGFGVVVYDFLGNAKDRESRGWLGIFLITLLSIFSKPDYLVGFIQHFRLSTVVSIFFAFILIVLHPFDSRIGKHKLFVGMMWIGSVSYSLYLTHHYILRVVLQLFEKLRVPDPSGILGLFIGVVGSLVFALLFYRFCEKPFLKKRPVK